MRVKDIAKSTKLSVFGEDFGSYEYILEERGDGEEMEFNPNTHQLEGHEDRPIKLIY